MEIRSSSNIFMHRFAVAFFAAFFAFPSFVIWGQAILDLIINYIVLAIFFDQISRFIKPAPIEEEELQEIHKVTQAQLDLYIKSKRNYRLFAAGLAVIIGGIASLLGYNFKSFFTVTCSVIWCFYPLYRTILLKIPSPKWPRSSQINSINNFDPLMYPHDRMYDGNNPRSSLAWNAEQCRRTQAMIESFNSITSHSRSLH
ncbi:MAG: hypothetical protein J0H87_09080 [Holosporales bacterium]|nr:hypothetical protein [Holosporales bacterium]